MAADRSVTVTLGADVSGFVLSMKRAENAVDGVTDATHKTAKASRQDFETVGRLAMGAGIAITAAMGLSAKAAIDFERSFVEVRKTVNATEPEFAALQRGIRDMATTMPQGVHVLNDIAAAAGRLGVENDNILGFTKTVADLAVTTSLSSDHAADAMARLANITQMPQEQFSNLGSAVVDLGNNMETTESEILTFALRVAGAGEVAGFTEADILGISAAMASLGIPAEAGGTAISRVMIEIDKAVSTGSDSIETFAEVSGVTAEQFAAHWESDPAQALNSFIEGLSKVDEAGGNTFVTLEKLGFGEIRTRDALLRLSSASTVLAEGLDLSSNAWEKNIALQVEADKFYATTAAKIDMAKNSVYDAAITMGQTFLPVIDLVVGGIGGLADAFQGLPSGIQTLTAGLGGITGVASLAAGAFLLLAPRIVETKAAFAALATSMPRTVGLIRGAGALLAGPWGIALAAGVGLVAKFAQMHAESEREIQSWMDTLNQQTGAITGNTRAKLANDLAGSGLIDQAKELGIPVETLTRAILGNSDAQDVMNAALAANRDEINAVSEGVPYATGAIDQFAGSTAVVASQIGVAQERTKEYSDVMQALIPVYGGSAAASQAYTDRLQGQWEQYVKSQEAAAASAQARIPAESELTTALRAQVETMEDLLGLMDQEAARNGDLLAATRAYEESKDNLRETLEETTAVLNEEGEVIDRNNATLDLSTEKGRQNSAALQTMAESAMAMRDASIENGASITEVNATLEQQRSDLYATAIEFGATEAQASEYADMIVSIDDNVYTRAQFEKAQAERDARTLLALYGRMGGTITTVARTIRTTEHRTLGTIAHVNGGPGGITENAASGGHAKSGAMKMVGEHGPELVRFGGDGYVFDAAKTQRMLSGASGGSQMPDIVGALEGMSWNVELDPSGMARITARGQRDLARRGA